jgi:Leucine-rich repeat (LRR) protein
MKNFVFFLIIFVTQLLFIKSQIIDSKTVNCKHFQNIQWIFLGFLQTCFMDYQTTIDSDDYQLGLIENQIFDALSFASNNKIEYLPKAHREISNIKIYAASSCLIKKISYENFEGLKDLRFLLLSWNQIEIIPRKTFCDLTSLTQLYLRKKEIE